MMDEASCLIIEKRLRPNSKEIIKTMESVIESVTKKRKNRKKKNRTPEPDVITISNAIANNLSLISPNTSLDDSKSTHLIGNSSKENYDSQNSEAKKLSTEKRKSSDDINENGNKISNIVAKSKEVKKRSENASIKDKLTSKKTKSKELSKKNSHNKMNAFEIMMNARNQSIGSNSLGNEFSDKDEVLNNKDTSLKEAKTKRKQLLEEWAEKKSALKRKIDEVREEYIERKLEERSKRFKRMLVNGSSSSSSTKNEETRQTNGKVSRKTTKSRDCLEDSESNSDRLEPSRKKKSRKKDSISPRNYSKTVTTTIVQGSSVNKCSNSRDSVTKNPSDLKLDDISSSPIKKRDSLLGYFSKKSPVNAKNNEKVIVETNSITILNSSSDFDSKTKKKNSKRSEKNIDSSTIFTPPSETSKNTSNTKEKKKNKRRKRQLVLSQDNDEEEKLNSLESISSTPTSMNGPKNIERGVEILSSRPRRSCTAKARYDYDLVLSPVKEKRRSKKQGRHEAGEDVSRKQRVSYSFICMDDDDSINSSSSSGKVSKLAPIFMKSLPKPAIDPEIAKARQEFLMSGVPEKVRLEMEKQKQLEQAYDLVAEQFPITRHVHQAESLDNESSSKEAIDWEKCGICWKATENSSVIENRGKLTAFKYMNDGVKDFLPLQHLEKIQNKQVLAKCLKNMYDKFPTYRCYNQLREKYRQFSAIDSNLETHQITDSIVVTKILKQHKMKSRKSDGNDDNEDDNPPPMAPNGELLFTEKYKPTLLEHVLVNLNPFTRLKEFLSSWKNRKSLKMDNSMSDFESTNDCDTIANYSNTVVLVGPHSSGKTNAVFTVANELNFNVLEINAGMKRTGKRMLQELQEATQSHQVRKDGVNVMKQTSNGTKKSLYNDNSSSSAEIINSNEKLCLILIEDADIIFEQDNGFIDAINQLSAISKRPVVITASNRNCQHLIKLISQHSIEFSPPNTLNISKFLSILSLIENCLIELDDIVSLYMFNQKDLRKTLLEMQFFIQSGGDRRLSSHHSQNNSVLLSPHGFSTENPKSPSNEVHKNKLTEDDLKTVHMHKTLFDFYTTDQNINWKIPFPIDYKLLWLNLEDIFKASENLKSKEEPSSSNHNLKCLTEFYENISIAAYISKMEYDRELPNISEELSHTLVENAIETNLRAGVIAYNLFDRPSEWVRLSGHLSSSSSVIRSNRSLNLDYEPCLRSICRREKSRLQTDRRRSKFYHYLRNVCTSNLSTNMFDRACGIFEGKTHQSVVGNGN